MYSIFNELPTQSVFPQIYVADSIRTASSSGALPHQEQKRNKCIKTYRNVLNIGRYTKLYVNVLTVTCLCVLEPSS